MRYFRFSVLRVVSFPSGLVLHRPVRGALLLSLKILLIGICLSADLAVAGGLKIYYMRHAEGGHNVREEWEILSKKKWPDFVGDSQQFTPKGEAQRQDAVKKLRRYRFDFIASSSMWRARNTVIPYLDRMDLKGEVWPELSEMYVSSMVLDPDLPRCSAKILGEGDAIKLPSNEKAYFSLRKDGTHDFELPDFPDDHSEKPAETAAAKQVLDELIALIQKRFGGTDASLLLVGHGSSGKGLLRVLTDDPLRSFPSLTNAGLWMVEEQDDGSFELKMYNDVPLDRRK